MHQSRNYPFFRHIAFCFFVLSGCGRPTEPERNIYKAEKRSIITHVTAHGTIEISSIIEIRPKVTGTVSHVMLHMGDKVEAGEILGRIDNIGRIRDVDAAKVELEIASLELEREIQIASSGDGKSTSISIDIARKKRELSEIKLNRANDQLDACLIRAPVDGTIASIKISNNDVVYGQTDFGPGTLVAEIAGSEDYLLKLMLDEVSVARITVGQSCMLTIDAIPGLNPIGEVSDIGAVSHAAGKEGLFPVTVRFHTISKSLKAGMSGLVDINAGTKEAVVTVPIKAIGYENDASVVYVPDGGGVPVMRKVVLGPDDGEFVEIVVGLNAGENVVVESP